MNRLTAVMAALSTIVLLASEPAIGPAAGAQVSCSAGQQMMPKGKGTCENLPAGAPASGCPSGMANGTGGCSAPKSTITCAAGQEQMMPKGTCVNLPGGAATTRCPSGIANGTGGCAPATGLSVTVTGTNASNFPIVSNTCGATLAGGAHCSVSVRFRPASIGVKSASLTVYATPSGSAHASLSGTGT